MPVSGTAAGRAGNHRLRFVVVEDHSLTRIAVLVLGGGVSAILARLADGLGWLSMWGAGVGVLCVATIAATGWIVIVLGRGRHLVVAVDATGISVGPRWVAYLRGEPPRQLPWRQVGQVEVFAQDYGTSYRSMVRHHVRVTTGDGRQFERALPASADVAALERVLGRVAPGCERSSEPFRGREQFRG